MRMLSVAYIANEFPVAVEPYVAEEICELRKHGIRVLPCSIRRPQIVPGEFREIASETLFFAPLRLGILLRALWDCLRRCSLITNLFRVALTHREETYGRRIRALIHTLIGIYYAVLLSHRRVEHIHVHHGYFAAWVAMTAARLLGITYSMTLHGSDLLLHHAFLNLKLQNCKFCLTVSEFNRKHILASYPQIDPRKIRVQRMGVKALRVGAAEKSHKPGRCLVMLSVGRLHLVKDHEFLLRACSQLKTRGVKFVCLIAGEGPERKNLEKLIRQLNLEDNAALLGHVSKAHLESHYAMSDLVVLTSRSEGVPLVLMEAMVHGRTILAPAITGIPELVVDGRTGFLYQPGSIEDFVAKVEIICALLQTLGSMRDRARQHVLENFNHTKNLATFANLFPALVAGDFYANPLL